MVSGRSNRRRLELGNKNAAVKALQERLLALGYDPGPVDGQFGYLTQDALITFQKDHLLRPDGVAGPLVLQMLEDMDHAPACRAYVLGEGETIADAAMALGTSVEALRHMNGLLPRTKPGAGSRLVCRAHYLVAAAGQSGTGTAGWQRIWRRAALFSAMAVPAVILSETEIEVAPLPPGLAETAGEKGVELWLTVGLKHHLAGRPEEEASLSAILSSRRRRCRIMEAIADSAAAAGAGAGLWLDVANIHWGEGSSLLYLIRLVKERCGRSRRRLMVSLPMPQARSTWRFWFTDIDYARIASLADWVVLAGHHLGASRLRFAQERREQQAVLRLVPPWKTLAGISVQAEERGQNGRLMRALGYDQALLLAYKANKKPVWNEEYRCLNVELADSVLWLPEHRAILERLAVLNRAALGGAVLFPAGEEDNRLWSALPLRLLARKAMPEDKRGGI